MIECREVYTHMQFRQSSCLSANSCQKKPVRYIRVQHVLYSSVLVCTRLYWPSFLRRNQAAKTKLCVLIRTERSVDMWET